MKRISGRIKLALVLLVLLIGLNARLKSQAPADILKYSVTAAPGNLQVNRMPGTNPPRAY
jgi:hypothetical protein